MAVIAGGIFSKPRGKIGGLVAGAARTRSGKLATLRELVPPSNPNTAGQQTQRSKFKSALDLVKRIGSSIYRTDWNRSVGQLPGFQSVMSVLLNSMSATKLIDVVSEVNLGSIPNLVNASVTDNGNDTAILGFSSPQNYVVDPADKVVLIVFGRDDATRLDVDGVDTAEGDLYQNSDVTSSTLVSGKTYSGFYYIKGGGANAGNYSNAIPFSVAIA